MGPTSLADQVLLKLHDAIIAGEHPVDRPIRQDTLALSLGISKIPVREALNRLEREGLIVSHPNRGFVVRRLSASDALEIVDIRVGLEGRLLARALEQASPDRRARAYAEAQAAGAALRPGAPAGWPESFFKALAAPDPQGSTSQGSTSQGFTSGLLGRLWVLSEHYARSCGDEHAPERAAAYRRSLLVAWRSGRPGVVSRAATRGLTAEHEVLSAQIAGAVVLPETA